jgi:hypothetical protein
MTTATVPFGRLMTAMITPMADNGAIDYDGAARLAVYLVDDMRNEGLVVNGTTGEAPTTTDAEQKRLIEVVKDAVGDRASVVAGVGTNITAHTIELARQAEQAGADGLLVVTPYYSRPAQDALAAHFSKVADSTGLPMLVYDIPGRTGAEVESETLVRLAGHPRIIGVKDAKDRPGATSWVLARTDLVYYCGSDLLNLRMSRWLVGSSRIRWLAPWAMAWAISTRCFSPPDSVLNPRWAKSWQPTCAIARSVIARSVSSSRAKARLCGVRPIMTISATVKSNSRVNSWATTATRRAASLGRIASRSAPSRSTCPAVGRCTR